MEITSDKSLKKAKKKFIISVILLIVAVIYLISPVDLIPGPPPFEWVEDIPILIAASLFSGYSYNKLKKERQK